MYKVPRLLEDVDDSQRSPTIFPVADDEVLPANEPLNAEGTDGEGMGEIQSPEEAVRVAEEVKENVETELAGTLSDSQSSISLSKKSKRPKKKSKNAVWWDEA